MDTALKQRLVGASVLIALAVVVLPMILGGRPESDVQETQKIELPSQPPELDFKTRRYPIGEQPPAQRQATEPAPAIALPTPDKPAQQPEDASTAPGLSQDAIANITSQETVKEGSQPEPVLDTPPLDEPGSSESAANMSPADLVQSPATTSAPAADKSGRYVVQVASFGAVSNANRLSKTLSSYGYSVLLDTIKSDVGTLHRVRVGPYSGESEANGVVTRLQTQVKDIKPRVMDLQPEKAAQVTQPSDPLVRWVVQVGSFSNSSNADKLVARLKLESMTAYKEQVSSKGSTTYRVRVGPFLEREEAIRTDTLINQRLSIDGVVMSAD